MKTMKQDPRAILRRPGAANLTRNQEVARCRLVVQCLIVCAALTQCLTLARAADVLPVGDPDSQPAPAQKLADPVQGRQMERYKAFVRQADLPPITATTNVIIEVGGVVKADVARLAQLSMREKEALAGQFSVPVGVIDKLVERVATDSPPSADRLIQELRTTVIDYRFLHIEWDRYHPPAEGMQTRSNALEALQAGDLAKAWELYDGLARPAAPAIAKPAPPTNLRVVGQ